MNSQDELKARQAIPAKKRVVVKIGTSSLTYPNGKPNLRFFDSMARQLMDLQNRGYEMVLVSSGAIAMGMPSLGYTTKPKNLPEAGLCSCWAGNAHASV